MATEKIFKHDPSSSDPWNAYNAASAWLKSEGYSIGSMERGAPTAFFHGDCDVSKWRNLSQQERREANGTIEPLSGSGTFRDSNIIVTIKRLPEITEGGE